MYDSLPTAVGEGTKKQRFQKYFSNTINELMIYFNNFYFIIQVNAVGIKM